MAPRLTIGELFGDGPDDPKDIKKFLDSVFSGGPLEAAARERAEALEKRLRDVIKTRQRQHMDDITRGAQKVYDDIGLKANVYSTLVSEIRAGTDAAMPTWWDKVTGNRAWQRERRAQAREFLDELVRPGLPYEGYPELADLDMVIGPDSPFPERVPINEADFLDRYLSAIEEIWLGLGEYAEDNVHATTAPALGRSDSISRVEERSGMRPKGDLPGGVAELMGVEPDETIDEMRDILDDLHRKGVQAQGSLTQERALPPRSVENTDVQGRRSYAEFLKKYGDWPSLKNIMSVVPLSAVAGALSPLDALEFAATPVALGSGDVPREQPRVPTIMEGMSPEEKEDLNRLTPARTLLGLAGIVGPISQRPETPVLRRSFRGR
tara:strand:+ start:11574 stop:12713 length:1140 start_codon:yes stop_codon:yes gene_type:complete